MKVKEQRNIESNELTGYLLNGIFVPRDRGNRHYQEIQKWIKKGNQPEPAFTEEERLNYFKNKLINNIQNIADTKSKEAKNYIAGKKVTPEQINRYELKYQTALKCKETEDYTPLQLEADLQRITPEELAELIIQKHDKWIAELQKYTALIEAYRVKAQTIVENLETLENIEKAKELLEKAKGFGLGTTEEQIKALFKEFEGDI